MVKRRKMIAKKPTIVPAADDWVTDGIDPDVEEISPLVSLPSSTPSSLMSLEDIKDRESETRQLNQKHVDSIVISIEAIGLIEPLVVDQDGVLLAGGHRKEAIALLQQSNPDAFNQHFSDGLIPVRVMPFTVADNPEWALDVEVSENEVRRDYSKQEVLKIAKRLRDAGYKDTPGKPKKGEKRLKPAIQTIIGKSMRTVERYLASEKNETPTNGEVRKNDGISDADKHLKRAIASLEKWKVARGRKNREKILLAKIDSILAELFKGLE